MSLADRIRTYYWDHFTKLPEAAQFHFANRLAAWEQDLQAAVFLKSYKERYVPATHDALTAQLEACLSEPPRTTMPAYEQRLPFFEAYPQLYGLHQALFTVRHLDRVYNVQAKDALHKIFPSNDAQRLCMELCANPLALKRLSTIAVNTVYLSHLYMSEKILLDARLFLVTAHDFEAYTMDELRLKLYLLTHCIIAASNFYTQDVPRQDRDIYYAMLAYLEEFITENYRMLSLDTKLEFLVCCRIMNYPVSIDARIYDECERSISSEGMFLIDTHNDYASRQTKRSFADSEHRNVLFILSSSPYHPQIRSKKL